MCVRQLSPGKGWAQHEEIKETWMAQEDTLVQKHIQPWEPLTEM